MRHIRDNGKEHGSYYLVGVKVLGLGLFRQL